MDTPVHTGVGWGDEPIKGLVSVALVVYNGTKYLPEAVDSVLAQTYRPIELIVVDDGSTDDTWSLLQSYGDRIVAIHQANGGLPVARNTAIRHARGEFIALMDHDDVCTPERVSIQVAFLRRHSEVGLCCSDFSAFDDRGQIEASHIASYYSQCDASRGGLAALYPGAIEMDFSEVHADIGKVTCYMGDVYEKLAFGNFVHPPTVMVRATVARAVGLFDPQARTTCDWDWNVRVSRQYKIGHVHLPLLAYRRSRAQMSGLLHRASGHRVTFEVAQRIFAKDPMLMRRHKRRAREALGEFATDAAYANSDSEPRLAWTLLWRAMWGYRYVRGLSWRTLAKLVLPTRWLRRQHTCRDGTRRNLIS